ncbi:MAG: beta-N-acetylhexosaminidase [Bacteroidota bacterium]
MIGCGEQTESAVTSPTLIPKPQQMELRDGQFLLDDNTRLFAAAPFEKAVGFLRNYVQLGSSLEIPLGEQLQANILLLPDASLPAEGYTLDVSEEKITIKASDGRGAFYAVQTLRQLMPVSMESEKAKALDRIAIPSVFIEDAPQFRYRGMHLDVARHFFDVEFVKEYISHLSMLKMNYFHWHLTEDQGWRIEIKKYPRLTSHAAYREETLIGHYNDTPHQFDGKRYGGFYTQEEVREIVAYADSLNVTIIPEIEMPGHSQAAISAYPELGCTGKPVPVATKWGVFEDIYCPTEKTFAFLEDVLTEVMALFPGEYIHIGGDEAPKIQWKESTFCQNLIKELGLEDENELQSYFIKRIEAFVNSKGKKIIGWDEILEGGLAPNATVMSWRGTQGAIEAAQDGHDVILTPGSHAYFDHYQAEHEDEPLAIGGFLPLKKVYSFNPIPSELTREQAQWVLGAQGNVWSEYMTTASHVEYMVFPRILAMSEVVWNGPSTSVEEDYPDFLRRVESFMNRLDQLEVNYANHLYDVEGKVVRKQDSLYYELLTAMDGKSIWYTMNSEEKRKYEHPIPITGNTRLEAYVQNRIHVGEVTYHKGVSASVTLNVEPHPAYATGGKEALVNGVAGSSKRYGDKEWLGFWGDDLEITIDFSEPVEVSKVSTRFFNANGQWIYAPKEVQLRATLSNGEEFGVKQLIELDTDTLLEEVVVGKTPYPKGSYKRLVLTIPNYGVIPDGKQGAGHKAWTFIDEIRIE